MHSHAERGNEVGGAWERGKSLPWRVLHHPFGVLVAIFLILSIVSVDALFQFVQKPKYSLRSEPIEFSEAEIEDKLNVKKDTETYKSLNATVWRPQVYVENEYGDNADGTVTDHATGLMWQQSGSDNFMAYKDAEAYAEERNKEKFAGYSDWRLPTMDELLSLMEPAKQSDGLFIDPIFDRQQRWCWSSDKRAGGGVWLVLFSNGNVNWSYESYGSIVRLVRRGQ